MKVEVDSDRMPIRDKKNGVGSWLALFPGTFVFVLGMFGGIISYILTMRIDISVNTDRIVSIMRRLDSMEQAQKQILIDVNSNIIRLNEKVDRISERSVK
jgi:hypothetical protein